jgi:hypothetical protein
MQLKCAGAWNYLSQVRQQKIPFDKAIRSGFWWGLKALLPASLPRRLWVAWLKPIIFVFSSVIYEFHALLKI